MKSSGVSGFYATSARSRQASRHDCVTELQPWESVDILNNLLPSRVFTPKIPCTSTLCTFTMTSKQRNPNHASGGIKNIYLLTYNFVSTILWFSVLGRVLIIGGTQGLGSGKVYDGTEEFARLVQTGAVLEVVHSLLGMHNPSTAFPYLLALR
jgi:hypothetical protein